MKDKTSNKIIFAVGIFGSVLINCNVFVKNIADDICTDRMDELVDNREEIPTEIGLYSGLLTIEHSISELENANNWELDSIRLSNCIKLNKLEL